MKKLKLKVLELGAQNILTRGQLKNIMGGQMGSAAPWCDLYCCPAGSTDCGTGTPDQQIANFYDCTPLACNLRSELECPDTLVTFCRG